jgi:hypothetical protein
MRDEVLEIRDKRGTTFKMKVSTPTSKKRLLVRTVERAKDLVTINDSNWFDWALSGDWKTVGEGFIRYRVGKTRSRPSGNGDLTTRDLLILGAEGIKTYDGQDLFGMQLFEYEDLLGTNSSGEGLVIQPWVIALTSGRISWKLLH